MAKKFELTFHGAALARGFPRYRRWHATFDAAGDAAGAVLSKLDEQGRRAAHPAIIYGPDCGRDGFTIS